MTPRRRRPSPIGTGASLLGAFLAACAGPAAGPGRDGPAGGPLPADLVPIELRCEYRDSPVGIDVPSPRLSWRLSERVGGSRGLRQSAWRVLVASSRAELTRGHGDLWDSGRVQDARTAQIRYGGTPLPEARTLWWAVRVWDQDGRASALSAPACFTTAIPLEGSTAQWIGRDAVTEADELDAVWMRTEFELDEPPQQALLTVASLGYHAPFLNGQRVGDEVLQPCTSDLGRRVRSVTHDVTEQLVAGRNVLAVELAEGWARFATYGCAERPLLRAALELVSRGPNGSEVRRRIETGPDWRWRGATRRAIGGWQFGDYGGEEVHVGSEPEETPADPALDASAWAHVRGFDLGLAISAQQVEPDRRMRSLTGTVVEEAPTRARIDFGRVFTGQLELEIELLDGAGDAAPTDGTAPASGTVEIAVSEREDQDCTYSQRSRLVLDTARGTFEHRFNTVCGRWALLEGPQPFRVLSARAWPVHTDYARGTRFACSDPLLQSVHDTIVWTLRCLSLGGYVVDCAHRERWGYGGDAHATMGTALTHFRMGAFYTKWLEDWRDVQAPDGALPYTAPTHEGGGGPAWSGIVVQLPWELWVQYGDEEILRTMQPTMERWLAWLETHVVDGILQPHGHPDWGFLGDWVPPGRGQGKSERVDDESTLFFNNAYWLLCLQRMEKIAGVLGQAEKARDWHARAEALRTRVNARFYAPESARYASGEQPYQALALLTDLPEPEWRARVLEVLVRDIEARGGHLDSGIHGTWLLLEALHRVGRDDLIWTVASQRDYPSWGHMLAQGATTIWEQWDGVHSRTHSSFLSLGQWFVRSLGGIEPDPAAPGYASFRLRPWFGLTEAEAHLDSIRGPIESHWTRDGSGLAWSLRIPPNTTATLELPASLFGSRAPAEWADTVHEGNGPLAACAGRIATRTAADGLEITLGSGSYTLRIP